jgi:hypothetical protein
VIDGFDSPCLWAWDLDSCLIGHDLNKWLVFFNLIAYGDLPVDDLTFSDAFSKVRQFEFK